MRGHGALGRRTLAGRHGQRVPHPDPRDPQHLVHRFHVAFDGGGDRVGRRRNVARLQRAGQGSEQSGADRRDDVIERRRNLFVRFDAVEPLDAAVDAEPDRRVEVLEPRLPDRPAHPLDPHAAGVNDLSHYFPLPTGGPRAIGNATIPHHVQVKRHAALIGVHRSARGRRG